MFIQLNFFQNDLSLFLAVQDSSIGDPVTHSLTHSLHYASISSITDLKYLKV